MKPMLAIKTVRRGMRIPEAPTLTLVGQLQRSVSTRSSVTVLPESRKRAKPLRRSITNAIALVVHAVNHIEISPALRP
jgi:hypothetical protein